MTAADVLVIGGGVIGASVTYYLTRAGLQVTLCDRGDIASGTSSACEGQMLAVDKRPGYDLDLALTSQKLLSEISGEFESVLQYQQTGSLLAVEEEDLHAAREFVTRRKQAGLRVDLLDAQTLRSRVPALAEDIAAGIWCPSDATLNPMALAYGMTVTAQESGARVLPYTEVLSIKKDAGGAAVGVSTSDGDLTADRVVCAAGVWTPGILQTVGVDVPIRPRKGHVLVAQRGSSPYQGAVQEFGYQKTILGMKRGRVPSALKEYGIAFVYEYTRDGNFLVGASRQFAGFSREVDPDVVRWLARRAIRFVPGLSDINVIRIYTGFRPHTPDHRPIVSRVPGVPGLFIAAGHEGAGVGLAAVTGRLTADLVCGRAPVIDPEPLQLGRFTEGGD